MLRVGLTGGLGSGKSTAARMFAEHGAYVFSADEIGRSLMQPGQAVYDAIVERFGSGVVCTDASLDRQALARLAFDEGRLEELEAIVHPATIARQVEMIEEVAPGDPHAVVIVESALLFETKYGGEGGWEKRFERIIFVRADEELRIARFVARSSLGRTLGEEESTALEADARRRLAQQGDCAANAERCDYVLNNDGSAEELRAQVNVLWPELKELAERTEVEGRSLQ